MKTFKMRKGHAEPTAGLSAYMVLTTEQVDVAEALAKKKTTRATDSGLGE